MGSMPGRIAKPALMTKLQDYINSDLSTVPARMRDKLETQTLIELIENATRITFTQEEKDHLFNDWFRDWWPPHQPVEPIVRAALIKALDIMATQQIPLDWYWICATDLLEAYITQSPQQVNLILMTPPPPSFGIGPFTTEENIWVARNGLKRGEQFETRNDTTQVITVRLLGD